MPCQDCDQAPENPIFINTAQDAYCEQCGDDANSCLEKIDASCVVYHFGKCNAATTLPNLGIASCTNLQTILETLDTLLGSTYNVPLIASDSPTINMTQWGPANHTFKGDVKISADTDNALTVRGDGLFASDSGKVRIDASDSLAYLEDQVDEGTDPLGIVSITITKSGGKLIITPTINITAICTALQAAGCGCGAPSEPLPS